MPAPDTAANPAAGHDAAPDPPDQPVSALLDAFWSVARRLRHSSADALAQWDMTPSQARGLGVLAKHGSMRPGELARHLHIAPRSATEVVDALDERGWVERGADPADRRATLLRLTRAGEQATERIRAVRARQAEELFGHLTPADQAELIRLLGELRAHLDGERPHPC